MLASNRCNLVNPLLLSVKFIDGAFLKTLDLFNNEISCNLQQRGCEIELMILQNIRF